MNEEVMRRLEKIDEKIDKLAQQIAVSNAAIEKLINQRDRQFKQEFITRKEAISLSERVEKIEGYINWGVKIVIGSVIAALLALIGLKR